MVNTIQSNSNFNVDFSWVIFEYIHNTQNNIKFPFIVLLISVNNKNTMYSKDNTYMHS